MIQATSFKDVDVDPDSAKSFRIYLGRRKMNPAGKNAVSVRGSEDLYSIPARFISDVEPEPVADMYLDGPTACRIPFVLWRTMIM